MLLFLFTPITPPISEESIIIIKRKNVLILGLKFPKISAVIKSNKNTIIPIAPPIKSPFFCFLRARKRDETKLPIAAEIVAKRGEYSYQPSIKYITVANTNKAATVTPKKISAVKAKIL